MKKVLVTRPKAQAAEFGLALQAAGFEAVYLPVIDVHPVTDLDELKKAMQDLSLYDWVVFTSTNAVEITWAAGWKGGRARVAAIGPRTAGALRQRGVDPDFIPCEFTAEAILPGLGDLRGKLVLLPRGDIARRELPDAIQAAGGTVHEIIVYRTMPAQVEREDLEHLAAGVDVVTFTSASGVVNFVQIMRQHGLDPLHLPHEPRIVCIGPVTAEALRDAGFEQIAVAEEFTTDGLVELIKKKEA